MIRIDEIYSGVFAPAIARLDGARSLHWFDPFGSTSWQDLVTEPAIAAGDVRYVFWDQEPMTETVFDQFMTQFREPFGRQWNPDVRVIVSEQDSELVESVSARWNLRSHYYWFHGWAALDWYRGYNRSGLGTEPESRAIARTFVAPNRIIGGARQHRLEILYWIFRQGLHATNWVSCPAVCPAEHATVASLTAPLRAVYPDIATVYDRVTLPINMPGETEHPMTSCWLDLWPQVEQSLVYVVTETVADGHRQHLTEKIFKPICQQIPFVLVGTSGALAYLRSYGFQTFDRLWDESYDAEPDRARRVEKIGKLLGRLNRLTQAEQQSLYEQAIPIVRHNYDHFYSGAFEQILWDELCGMIKQLE